MAHATTRVHCFGTCYCPGGQKIDWMDAPYWTHVHCDEFVVPVVAAVIDVALSAASAAAVPRIDVPELRVHFAENDVSLPVVCTYSERTWFTQKESN